MSKAARNKSRELRQAQIAAARIRRNRMRFVGWLGGVVIAGLLVAIVAVVITSLSGNGSKPQAGASGPLVTPSNLTSAGAIPVGQATAPVTLEIYLDYMCPACGKFEKANTGDIDRLVQAGTVKLALRPIAFLDKQSQGTNYSSRAANAAVTVAHRAPTSVWAFSKALFDHQPEEGTAGLSDAQIAEIALNAGVPQNVTDTFTQRTFQSWVAKSTDDAFASGITGTPTVKINGTEFKGDLYNAGPLAQALQAAADGAN